MRDTLTGFDGPEHEQFISFLVDAARKTGPSTATIWHTRMAEVYGDLGGQRAVRLDQEVKKYLVRHAAATLPELIIALQTYFALICDILTLSHLAAPSQRPAILRENSGDKQFFASLEELASGRIYTSVGVSPASNPVPFDWYLSHLSSQETNLLRRAIVLTVRLAKVASRLPPHVDLMQWLYAKLMPRNLLHVLGEFYTPPWLARLLVEDAQWEPTKRLIDPFAGSGVFIVAALNWAKQHGCRALDALKNLSAIDLNPMAYVATRTNTLLTAVESGDTNRSVIRLPVLCADALLPCSIQPGKSHEAKLAAPADVLLTNPPWVGWEYMSRPYRTLLNPAWKQYGLFTAKGRDAAFLKEDLSTLALVVAWDRYLKPGGTSAVVLRPACMQSHLAGKGLRRLSIHPDSSPLCLRLIRVFAGLRPFASTAAPAAAWVLEKGLPTTFPVQVQAWKQGNKGWQPAPSNSLEEVRSHVNETGLVASRSNASDVGSAWSIGPAQCHDATPGLLGSNDYKVRTGVFTGGANAVYYLEKIDAPSANGCHWYRNIVARAKREVEPVKVELEDELIYEVVRGRDLSIWHGRPGALMLCPHSRETKMRAIPENTLARSWPRTFEYLAGMRKVLDERKGFSGWERHIQEAAFYAIQRIGTYTFSPYKTAWRYIATDFIVAVIGPDTQDRPRMCNDKVMYVSFDDEEEAYYFCGMLSSDPLRWCVVSTMTGTQISTWAIKHLRIPHFAQANAEQRLIAKACKQGHLAAANGQPHLAQGELDRINKVVARLYGLSDLHTGAIRSELARRFSDQRFP